jgi:Sulfatase-modifying factor enzyme 1
MIIQKHDPIDFEPLRVGIVLQGGCNLAVGDIHSYLDKWLSDRDANPVCQSGCRRKFLHVRQISNETTEVLIQWLCDQCMDVLFANLAQTFPNIERIVVGSPVISLDNKDSARSILFSGRKVTFEDGCTEVVDSFTISCNPVSVGQIRQFCAETKYLTSAERLHLLHTYGRNPFVTPLSDDDRNKAPARFLSYLDGQNYCSWAKVRLPTEGEYLAAALVDDAIHDASPEQVRALFLSGSVIRFAGLVITSTVIDKLVVCRAGPNVVKKMGWESRISDNRYLFEQSKPSGQIFTVSL